jgi:hypothetical protein
MKTKDIKIYMIERIQSFQEFIKNAMVKLSQVNFNVNDKERNAKLN